MRIRRILALIAAVVVIGAGVLIAWEGVPTLRIATAYAAKQTCSCLFVSRRSLESCLADYDPSLARWFSWDAIERAVVVSFAGTISSRATIVDGAGCHVAR
ncbi:MAG: hypothetical protein GY798_28210 [Hyphomicrobiales bacterium]|nr:hypothetical protein [Hyphomicrobiales bacterium]